MRTANPNANNIIDIDATYYRQRQHQPLCQALGLAKLAGSWMPCAINCFCNAAKFRFGSSLGGCGGGGVAVLGGFIINPAKPGFWTG
jgi:hypothetical protein